MSKQLYHDMMEQDSPAPYNEKQWIAYTGFSKEQNRAIADKIIADCDNGTIDSLDAYLLAKSMENTIKMVLEGIKDMSLTEAFKYSSVSQKTFTHRGCDITIKETGVKYDYENCGDVVWQQLNAEMTALKERIKEREAFLKTIKSPVTIASEQTEGELVTINPPVKSSTTGLSVTIK